VAIEAGQLGSLSRFVRLFIVPIGTLQSGNSIALRRLTATQTNELVTCGGSEPAAILMLMNSKCTARLLQKGAP
jgi:hypothetical protein